MKIEDINFLEIKQIDNNYISLSHYKNKPVIFNINNLEVDKLLYKDNDKLYMNFSYENTLVRLLILFEKYICKYVYKKNDIKINFDNFVEKTFFSSFIDDNKLKLEIHKTCLFIEEDDLLNQRQITYKDIMESDFCNLKIHFVGIKFLESKYEPIFLVRKMIKQIESNDNLEELILDSDDEEETDIVNKLYNDETITKCILQDYEKKEIDLN